MLQLLTSPDDALAYEMPAGETPVRTIQQSYRFPEGQRPVLPRIDGYKAFEITEIRVTLEDFGDATDPGWDATVSAWGYQLTTKMERSQTSDHGRLNRHYTDCGVWHNLRVAALQAAMKAHGIEKLAEYSRSDLETHEDRKARLTADMVAHLEAKQAAELASTLDAAR